MLIISVLTCKEDNPSTLKFKYCIKDVPQFIDCMLITVNFAIRLNGGDPRLLLEISLLILQPLLDCITKLYFHLVIILHQLAWL